MNHNALFVGYIPVFSQSALLENKKITKKSENKISTSTYLANHTERIQLLLHPKRSVSQIV